MVPIVWVEGPGAQDTNNDGIATLLEGSFDVDHDGWFTDAEADALGICRFIDWRPVDHSDPQWQSLPDKICVTYHLPGRGDYKACESNHPTFQCWFIVGQPQCSN